MNDSSVPTINYHDLNSLNSLRTLGMHDEKAALKAAAKQFEATFMHMLLQSMRKANEGFESDDETNSDDVKFYQGMYDDQLAATLSEKGSLGLADLMVRQLTQAGGDVQTNKVMDEQGSAAQVLPVNSSRRPDILRPFYKTTVVPSAGAINAKPEVGIDEKNATAGDPAAFVRAVLPHARRAAQQLGVDEKVLIAQAALETGWGKSLPHSGNNCFGIKSDGRWLGGSVQRRTLEVENGVAVVKNASFRAYDSIASSFDDYTQFVSGSNRYAAANNSSDARAYINNLANAGYATDPNYANKVMAIYQRDDLSSLLAQAQATL